MPRNISDPVTEEELDACVKAYNRPPNILTSDRDHRKDLRDAIECFQRGRSTPKAPYEDELSIPDHVLMATFLKAAETESPSKRVDTSSQTTDH